MKGNFYNLINDKKPVLVDFYATWCGPCKSQLPIIKDVSKALAGRVKIIKIDIDKNKQIAHKYKVRSVPTLALFEQGRLLWQEAGLKSKTQILKAINSKIKSS
jgi:thioredoxin 1